MLRTVRITANFFANLDAIRQFLDEQNAAHAFDSLLDELFDQVIANLERFPEMGRDFLARQPLSAEGHARVQRILDRIGRGVGIREYIHDEFVMLYTVGDDGLFLLSIRHHRQLSFDLRAHWT
jgi:ParE toxin of type II toxin-antitoxin system, parDE